MRVACWMVIGGLALGMATGCRQQADPGAAKGSTGATPASTATGVPPQQTDRASTGAADTGAPPPAVAGTGAGNADTARAELNPPDPGRPSANPEKGVTQPDPGYGHDHSSPKYGSSTTR